MRCLLIASSGFPLHDCPSPSREFQGHTAVQIGDTPFSAEFSKSDQTPDTLKDRDHVQAEVKDGKLIVKLRNGKRVSARLHWVQRVIIHPLPEIP
jgi:hypothetical protein